jgi:hypothetical protein
LPKAFCKKKKSKGSKTKGEAKGFDAIKGVTELDEPKR